MSIYNKPSWISESTARFASSSGENNATIYVSQSGNFVATGSDGESVVVSPEMVVHMWNHMPEHLKMIRLKYDNEI